MFNHELPAFRVVLLGIGHTNAHVVRMWRMHAWHDCELVCVSDRPFVTYSGMLPGVLAGQYTPERMRIDLVRLTKAIGARLILDQVTGLDAEHNALVFAQRPPLRFDALSIGIGSVPTTAGVTIAGHSVVPIKPMQTFLERLRQRLDLVRARRANQPIRIAVVGTGAGGTEIALCLPNFLKRHVRDLAWEIALIGSSEHVVGTRCQRTERLATRALAKHGIRHLAGQRVVAVDEQSLVTASGDRIPADIVLWATSAVGPPLLTRLGLPLDDKGFLLTNDCLQSTHNPRVFAVGDTGTIIGRDVPKAGVYAVRQGPLVWHNLRSVLTGKPLRSYQPQHDFLKLLNTGDGAAIGEYRGLAVHSSWAWRLKDWIDSRFMRMYQDYTPRMDRANNGRAGSYAAPPPNDSQPPVMRCAGCGGKVGAKVLAEALQALPVKDPPHVVLGLHNPDDAAVLRLDSNQDIITTVDFFTAPLDDYFLVGRVAALNALSDVYAMGGVPHTALALVALPPGTPRAQREVLHELLSGSLHELQRAQVALVGGHTIEQASVMLGFSILGRPSQGTVKRTAGLRAGDQLVLTKPLGTGVLLAAWQRAECQHAWWGPLVEHLVRGNGDVLTVLSPDLVTAVTDVTGFGCAGHLLEMLNAGNVAATVSLSALPLLPGAQELVLSGHESSLAPANRHVEAEIDVSPKAAQSAAYRLLFDPQTAGGLLLGICADDADAAVEALVAGGLAARRIGQVDTYSPTRRRLRIRE